MSLDELIEALEKASTGTPEIDEAICRRVNHMVGGRWTAEYDMDYGHCLYDQVEGGYESIPGYTRSIDAALTLVPEGCGFGLLVSCDKSDCRSDIWGDKSFDEFSVHAATPALALCIVSLKARKP